MRRIALTDGSARWFDADKAREWEGDRSRDGFHGSRLYRTRGGVWVLCVWSAWEGDADTYETINDHKAARWLVTNGYEAADECAAEYAALEIA